MKIVEARLPAADPPTLAAWYDENVGAAPTFVEGDATPHHFAFHVADLEPWKRRLETTEEHEFSSWGGARAVYFRDPEENVVELIARPAARPELSLAEVGLPVDDVPGAVETLTRDLGLAPYDEWSESFAPLGDDEGLLIVVRTGRGWFPVDVPAGAAAVEVTIAGAGSGDVRIGPHRVIGS